MPARKTSMTRTAQRPATPSVVEAVAPVIEPDPEEVALVIEPETKPVPVPVQRPLRPRGTVQAAVETNAAVIRVILALMQGQDHTMLFQAFPGFLGQLRYACTQENEEVFLRVLRQYLVQGMSKLPQMPRQQQIEPILADLTSLIEEYGIVPVARHILAGFA